MINSIISIADNNQLWTEQSVYIPKDLSVEIRYSHCNVDEKTFIVTWDLELGENTYNSMFQYISTYIESENWDRKEFKKIKHEEFIKLNVFLNQFHWNIKDIEIYNY